MGSRAQNWLGELRCSAGTGEEAGMSPVPSSACRNSSRQDSVARRTTSYGGSTRACWRRRQGALRRIERFASEIATRKVAFSFGLQRLVVAFTRARAAENFAPSPDL